MAANSPFGPMADTLRRYAGPTPDPIQQAAEHLRMRAEMPPNAGPQATLRGTPADPAFHGDGRYGAPPTGATNATAGATTQTQVPNGNTNVAGQQMGAANTGRVVPPDPASPGGKTSRLGAVKSFVTGAGASGGSVGGAFKSVASGAGGALRAGVGVLASPIGAVAAAGNGAYQGLNTDTDQYAKRFGLEGTEPGLLRDLGVRALGVASDVGNGLALGIPQALGAFRDKNEPEQAARPSTAAPIMPTAAPAATTPIVPANQRTRSLRDGGATPGETRGTFGDLSPVGTFAQGQTDLGGGIAGSGPLNSRGKFTEYTNIGVGGQPTALSQGDSRTPDQIANAARINAETAKFVAQRDRENRGSPGQQYIANMERMVGLPLGQIASRSLRNAIIAGAQQADKTGADNEAMLQKEGIASADRRLGHQVQLETAALPAKLQLQAAQQRRVAVGEALRAGGGDLRAAAQVLNNAGYTDAGKELMEQYAAGQTSAKNDVELNRNLTAASSVVKDDKGNDVISPARQAVNESALRQMVENYDQLSPQEKIAAEKQYRPALNILSGMNDRKDDTLFKKFGIDRSPMKTTLGNLEGAELGTVGFWEGLVTPGAERNDYVLRNGGRSQYINRDRISEAEEAFLTSHGVNLRGVK